MKQQPARSFSAAETLASSDCVRCNRWLFVRCSWLFFANLKSNQHKSSRLCQTFSLVQMIPGNCGDFGCVVGYPASERAETECGPSPEVNPGNGVLPEKAVFGRKWVFSLVPSAPEYRYSGADGTNANAAPFLEDCQSHLHLRF
jgi:hypothetical protein